MEFLIDDIALAPDEPEERLAERLAERLGRVRIRNWRVWRRSLDARKKDRIVFRYKIRVEVEDADAPALATRPGVSRFPEAPEVPSAQGRARGPAPPSGRGKRAIVVGAGPAGLFCALRLLDAGVGVSILERGRPVDERMRDIRRLETEGVLDPESNVLFGEGGAGAYSDGKLTTRTHRPDRISRRAWFYRRLADFGVPDRVLAEAKPHIGTDRLRPVLTRIRETLRERGAEIRFGRRVRDLWVDNGRVVGVTTDSGEEFRADAVVLAVGHSARDVYGMLRDRGVALAPKGFAVGVRVEHPAEIIRKIQYGRSPHRDILPPAEYQLTWNDPETKRGIYSFCMCPGGRVINSASENGGLCVNGMSHSNRGLPRSNAALVVTVNPADFASGPFASPDGRVPTVRGGCGVAPPPRSIPWPESRSNGASKRPLSRRAAGISMPGPARDRFSGGSGIRKPPGNFLSARGPAGSRPGFPAPRIVEALRRALPQFDRRMRGFVSLGSRARRRGNPHVVPGPHRPGRGSGLDLPSRSLSGRGRRGLRRGHRQLRRGRHPGRRAHRGTGRGRALNENHHPLRAIGAAP
jgi:uncharacterized protein